MKPLNYEVSTNWGPMMVGGFAVGELFGVDHREPGPHWVLTDLGSGIQIGKFRTRKDAVMIAEGLTLNGWPIRGARFGKHPSKRSAFFKVAQSARDAVLRKKRFAGVHWNIEPVTNPTKAVAGVSR